VVKREVFDKVGVFDYKTFKLGCTEEHEFIWRAKKMAGYKTYWAKKSYVHHFGHRTFTELGINPARYNKDARSRWENNKKKIKPKFIENDVEIKYIKHAEKDFGPRIRQGKIKRKAECVKTISLATNNRPEILCKCLDSLKNQMADLSEYKLYINSEPGCSEVIDIVKDIDFIETDIVLNKVKLGINANTYAPIKRAFEDGADFNLYWEDDIILSPDALNLFEWYTKLDLKDIASLCLCNLWDKSETLDENKIYKTRKLAGWGFVVSRHQFEKYFEPAWFPETGCWDISSARHIRTFGGVHNIVPQLSRSTNIGKFGDNMNPATWKIQMEGHKYNQQRKKFNYLLQDELGLEIEKENKHK